MRKGSTRSSYAMRQTGGDIDGISPKPLKKLKKLSSVGETYQSTSSKRVKLPKKLFDGCGDPNHSSVPRKVRSAMKKRHDEFVSLSIRNGITESEMASKDCNKKLKVETDDQQHSTMSESITDQITEDEKDVMAALLAIAGIVSGNDKTDEINLKSETSEASASSLQEKHNSKTTATTASKPEDLVQNHVQILDLNESTNTLDAKKVSEDFTDGRKLQKRCALHVYICRIIKDLQVTEGRIVNSHKESKARDYADAKTNTKSHGGMPVTHRLDAAPEQVSAIPYFGSPFYDPSQWSRPVFPKQQMRMNPFVPGTPYHNGRHETMLPMAGSYVGTSSGSKYVQPSLLDVLGSRDTRDMPRQLQYKMQFGHRSSGYEENRGSFFVDSCPTLKLTL